MQWSSHRQPFIITIDRKTLTHLLTGSTHLHNRGSEQTVAWITEQTHKASAWLANEGCLRDTHSPPQVFPYLPTQGRAFLKIFCSQDVSMDHIFHIGKVYQVLSIPAQTKGRRLAPRQVRLKVCQRKDFPTRYICSKFLLPLSYAATSGYTMSERWNHCIWF